MTVKVLGLNRLLTKSHAIVSRPPAQPSPLHFDDPTCPMRRYEALGVSLHTQPPGGRHPQPSCLACSSSAALTGTQLGCTALSWWGKFEHRRRTRRNFPVVTVAAGRVTGSRLHRVRRRPHQLQRSPQTFSGRSQARVRRDRSHREKLQGVCGHLARRPLTTGAVDAR